MGRTLAVRGQLRQAATWFEELIYQAGEMAVFPLAYLDLCTLHYEWDDLDAAFLYLDKGLEASQQIDNVEFQIAAHMLKVRVKTAGGDPVGVQDALEKIHHLEHSSQIPARTQARSADLAVQLALWQGDLQSAEQLASQLVPNIEAHPFYRFLGLTPARLLIAKGQRGKAAEQLQAAAQTAQRNDWGYALIAVRVLQALAAETDSLALEFLGQALILAQPHGYIRTFAEAGQRLAPLLQKTARRGLAPEYAGKILAAIQGSRKAPTTIAGLVEPLTEREIEVLGLVAAGLSNREIAGSLFLSLGTVKTHIHNLYGKLEVRNRTQAIARARELKLI
jgi:LuxR family maltose regulon positive regulatory protein